MTYWESLSIILGQLARTDPPHCPNDAPDCRPTDCPFCHEEPA